MIISKEQITHMHGVAEWMYEHAEEFGCPNKDEMYLLGMVHDIGYLYGVPGHEQKGAELLGSDSYYGKFVLAHSLTPQEYMAQMKCTAEDIPNELVLLWTADMTVDQTGQAVGFQKRLADIGWRHGHDSELYRKCEETMSWLENKKAIWFLTHQQPVIDDFHKPPYQFLSNFYEVPVIYKGYTFRNSEAAFQAQKCADKREIVKFTTISAKEAKALGRRVLLVPAWEQKKVNIMDEVLRAKFYGNAELREKLLATGDAKLIEGNDWGDTFWGIDKRTGKGQNVLGRLLMGIRSNMKRFYEPQRATDIDAP